MAAPAQDPALDFLLAAQLHFECRVPVFRGAEALGLVPGALADEPRGKGVELETDAMFLPALENTEAAA